MADFERKYLSTWVSERPHCQCSRWDNPCGSAITQEDLLCDTCREGCSLLKFRPLNADEWTIIAHQQQPEISFTPTI